MQFVQFEWSKAALEDTLWVGKSAVERYSDGYLIAIVDDDGDTVYRYDEGETAWADIAHQAAHPYTDY